MSPGCISSLREPQAVVTSSRQELLDIGFNTKIAITDESRRTYNIPTETARPPGAPRIVVGTGKRRRRGRERKQKRGCRSGLLSRLGKDPHKPPPPEYVCQQCKIADPQDGRAGTTHRGKPPPAPLAGRTAHRTAHRWDRSKDSDTVNKLQQVHPDGVHIIAGDFNQANRKSGLPTFSQRTITTWPEDALLQLQDCFADAECSIFEHQDLAAHTEAVLSCIKFCMGNVTVDKRIRIFPNRMTSQIRMLLRDRSTAFRSDTELYRAARANPKRGITKAKQDYKAKMEDHLSNHNPRQMWRSIQEITNFRGQNNTAVDSSDQLAEELNTSVLRTL
ncbi:hypothetical protein N1851_013811 [Merluccius polli]|uniref:Uncharacterized protein n=1 Tax=Merluccius polli TaxID=89951 RepID=A0AA47MVI8_MERPO|nr:hypothetical protein N1851_013811 [Merluccius polli]